MNGEVTVISLVLLSTRHSCWKTGSHFVLIQWKLPAVVFHNMKSTSTSTHMFVCELTT